VREGGGVRLRLYTDLTYLSIERNLMDMEKEELAYDTIRKRIATIRLVGNHMGKRGFPNPTCSTLVFWLALC
jgi:hypothetical protein